MIKAIIFDLGNVLLNWKPEEYFEKNGYSKTAKEVIINDIFSGREWQQIDNGEITTEEAIEKIAKRSSLSREEIRAVFDLRVKILYPLTRNIKLLPDLKKYGFKLYFLSNFPGDIFDEVYNNHGFFRFFDGGEISARVNVSKPDAKFYRLLMNRHSLVAEECLFIDDLHKNAVSAELLGMKVIHLEDPDLLKSKLETLLDIELN